MNRRCVPTTFLSMSLQRPADVRSVVVALALGRTLFGVALLLAPSRMAGYMWGASSPSPAARLYARGGGTRDIALGLATVTSPTSPTLLWMGAACDAADSAVAALDGTGVPRARRIWIAAGAGGLSLLHVVLALAATRASFDVRQRLPG